MNPWRDISAGLTVTLVGIPQCLAYAMLAGIPPIYGLVTAAIPGLVAALLGRSAHVTVGPTNTTGLLILTALAPVIAGQPGLLLPAMATLALLTGLVRLLIVGLRLERIFDFIPEAVIVGFASGAALMIVVMQLDAALAVAVDSSTTLPAALMMLYQAPWPAFSVWLSNALLALTTILVLMTGRRWLPRWPIALVWLIASMVLVGMGTSLSHHWLTLESLQTAGGWPAMALPSWDPELVGALLQPAIAIAFVGSLELVVILRRGGESALFRPEVAGQGWANMVGSVAGAFPASTSLTRSVLLQVSGARSRLAPVSAALAMLPFVFLAGPLISTIPQAVIAGMLFYTAWHMIDRQAIRQMLRAHRETRLLFLITFVAALLLPFHQAILLGAVAALILFVLSASTPRVHCFSLDSDGRLCPIEQMTPTLDTLLVQISGSLFYAAARSLPTKLNARVSPRTRQLYIDVSHCHQIRISGLLALRDIVTYFERQEIQVEIIGLSPPTRKMLRKTGLVLPVSEDRHLQQVLADFRG